MRHGGEANVEARLVVLERRRVFEWIANAAIALGAAGILAALALGRAFVLPAIYLVVFGALLRREHRRRNFLPRRREHVVRVAPGGVLVDGVLAVRRSAIDTGYFQPRPAARPESSVRLADERRGILFEVESDPERADQILRVLGLDAASHLATFSGSSPLFATTLRTLAVILCAAVGGNVLGSLVASLGASSLAPIAAVAVFPLALLGLAPSRIGVGVDGVLVSWLGRERFIPMATIEGFMPDGDRAITVLLSSASFATIYTSVERRGQSRFKAMHRDAVLARMREALAAHRSGAGGARVSALVARGARPASAWLASLAGLRDARGGYRESEVRDEDLWRLLEDPTAPEDARAGAAMVLRRSLDDQTRARIRVAAERTASPKLRVALDAAASLSEEDATDALRALG